jgi:hypothetical protein
MVMTNRFDLDLYPKEVRWAAADRTQLHQQ